LACATRKQGQNLLARRAKKPGNGATQHCLKGITKTNNPLVNKRFRRWQSQCAAPAIASIASLQGAGRQSADLLQNSVFSLQFSAKSLPKMRVLLGLPWLIFIFYFAYLKQLLNCFVSGAVGPARSLLKISPPGVTCLSCTTHNGATATHWAGNWQIGQL
jgi:hypothetical protein